MNFQDRARRKGKDVRPDSKFTGRKRKDKFWSKTKIADFLWLKGIFVTSCQPSFPFQSRFIQIFSPPSFRDDRSSVTSEQREDWSVGKWRTESVELTHALFCISWQYYWPIDHQPSQIELVWVLSKPGPWSSISDVSGNHLCSEASDWHGHRVK